MILTNLERKGKSELYKASLDNEYVCLLEAETIIKNQIKIGCELSDESFLKLRKESEILTCSRLGLKYISSAFKTKKQVQDYLTNKGFLKECVEITVKKLCDYGYLNDENFAKMFISGFGGTKGKLYLQKELKHKGIEDSIIKELLDEFEPNEEVLMELAQKFMKNKTLDKKNTEKLYRNLLSKGFTYEQVRNVVKKYNSGEIYDWD